MFGKISSGISLFNDLVEIFLKATIFVRVPCPLNMFWVEIHSNIDHRGRVILNTASIHLVPGSL